MDIRVSFWLVRRQLNEHLEPLWDDVSLNRKAKWALLQDLGTWFTNESCIALLSIGGSYNENFSW